MKNYEEIVSNILKRRDEYIKKQKKKKKIIATATPMICCAVVLVSVLTLGKGGIFQNMSNSPNPLPPQNPSNDIMSNVTPTPTPDSTDDFIIDSIDKMNFYSAKKIINDSSLLPFSDDNTGTFMSTSDKYIEYPIDRNKVFTATMVTYFTIELNDINGFLAQKLGGAGIVEVVVTENDIDAMGQMITFKRENNYYTCFVNKVVRDTSSNKIIREFSTHKYIDGFNVVNDFEQDNYTFTVHYEGSKVTGFETFPSGHTNEKYNVDDVTFIEDYCVVIYQEYKFTIEQLEMYFKTKEEGGIL